MGKSEREKGRKGELEVANILKDYGFKARRGLVFMHEADLVTELPIHFEVKRQETLRINDWWKQSESATGEDEIPTVVFRRNREPWKIMLSLTDFLEILNRKDIES